MSESGNTFRLDAEIRRPTRIPQWLVSVLLVITLVAVLYDSFSTKVLHDYAIFFSILFLVVSFVFSVAVTPRNFSVGFLGGLLAFLIPWRIGAMMGATAIMTASTVTFVVFVLQFFDCVRNNWSPPRESGWFGNLEWQMTFLRVYFGFNLVGHFTEKLFAGAGSFQQMGQLFSSAFALGDAGPLFVLIGGLCELGGAIGIGMGFLTRLAGVGIALFLFIATVLGNHFNLGFTWANPGGGWETNMLMMFFYLSFAFSGAGRFSLDAWLIRRNILPKGLVPLCISRAGRQ